MEVAVCPHKDLVGCTSMSLNSSGSLALLAGRRCYAVVSLACPDQMVHRESRQSKWEVTQAEWAAADDRLVAVAANNKVELLSWTGAELVLDTSLRAHTRAVTDLSWHTFDSQILATSAADTFIYLWDMRDLRRPKQSLSAVAGAAKIQWNKVSGKYLASAHEGELKLWDTRNTSSPVQYINAHLSRIYDIDWSHEQEDSLATSSQDATVQFWNLASPTKSENIIKLPGSPVWKLQHTPVGSGLLTLATQTVLRGQNNLMLWNIPDLRSPVHTFYAHDMVLDFGWFSSPGQNSRSQLVTWSRDCTLRIWELDSDVQRKCGLETELDTKEDCVEEAEEQTETESFFCQLLEKDEETEQTDNIGLVFEEDGKVIINSPASLQMKRNMLEEIQKSESYIPDMAKMGKSKSMNLNYEFSLINVSEKLNVVAQDAQERHFTVSAETDKNVLILHVKFPHNYPNQKAPIFSFLQGTTVDNTTRNNILVKLRNVSKQQISKNRRCLESCLRQFESCLEQLSLTEEEQIKLNNPGQMFVNSEELENRVDEKIPYPRSSGARFCGDGNLVCFGSSRSYSVPVAMTRVPDGQQIRTPRALSSMGSLTTPVSILASGGATSPMGLCTSPVQDSGYLTYQARLPRVRFSGSKNRFSVTSVQTEDGGVERKVSSKSSVSGRTGTVTVYSCSGLMPYSKELAPLYRVPSAPGTRQLEEVCVHNAGMARQVGRDDLADIWSVLSLTASGCSLKTEAMAAPWAMNPFGGRMVEDMVKHFVKIRDLQTAAVICAVFGNRCQDNGGLARVTRKKNSKSETLRTDSMGKETLLTLKKYSRTMSENINEDSHQMRKLIPNQSSLTTADEDDSPTSSDTTDHTKIIRPDNNNLYDSYILAYADLLYRWNMFRARTELLKCLSSSAQAGLHAARLTGSCPVCGQGVSGPRCVLCHAPSVRCALCRLPCPGSTLLCPRCSHGGHPACVREWLREHTQCATGCGCHCLKL